VLALANSRATTAAMSGNRFGSHTVGWSGQVILRIAKMRRGTVLRHGAKAVVSGSVDASVRVWDVASHRQISSLSLLRGQRLPHDRRGSARPAKAAAKAAEPQTVPTAASGCSSIMTWLGPSLMRQVSDGRRADTDPLG
jgi:hypothetical protein